MRNIAPTTVALGALLVATLASASVLADLELLNVSYDPTREFYEEFNRAFAAHWKGQTGETVTINQSHGGPASRPAPSSTGSKPTSSPSPSSRSSPWA